MKTPSSQNKNIKVQTGLMNFIRGRQHWNTLSDLGIKINLKKGMLELELTDSLNDVSVIPQVTDIIEGLLAYKNNPIELKEWAAVLLGLSIIDLSLLDSHPSGNNLKEIIWDLSFNVPIDQKVIDLAEGLQKS